MSDSTNSPTSTDDLFNFPCDFPIKVMGKSHPEFQETIVTVIREFDGEFDAAGGALVGAEHQPLIRLTHRRASAAEHPSSPAPAAQVRCDHGKPTCGRCQVQRLVRRQSFKDTFPASSSQTTTHSGK